MYYDLSQSRLQNELRQRSGDGRSKAEVMVLQIYIYEYIRQEKNGRNPKV
jgi:hypothetical protein